MQLGQVRLRTLTEADEALVREYLYLALFVPPGQPALPRSVVELPEIARYAAGWGRRGDRGVVAFENANGLDVGAAWLRTYMPSDAGYGFIDRDTPELSIAVRPEYRGLGIGTLLLERLLAEADQYCGAVSLSVSDENPAGRLYERLGFVAIRSAGGSTTMRRARPVQCGAHGRSA